MIIYGLKNCDTCRKAMKALPGATLNDVRAEGLDDSLLDRALAQFGDALVNTRSTTWRGLDAAQRARAPKDLIHDNPALMKRPLIAVDNSLFLGWNKEVEAELHKLV